MAVAVAASLAWPEQRQTAAIGQLASRVRRRLCRRILYAWGPVTVTISATGSQVVQVVAGAQVSCFKDCAKGFVEPELADVLSLSTERGRHRQLPSFAPPPTEHGSE